MVDRVMPELMYIGADYSQTVSQQEFEDKEWEQWLHIQDTTCSKSVNCLYLIHRNYMCYQ